MFHVVIILAFSITVLVGCAAMPVDASRSVDVSHQVQLLGFEGCPNTPEMEQRLRNALDRLGADWPVEYIDQEQLAVDDLQRGWPAPTILVDGHDLYGMAPPTTPSMGCRMYAGPGGVPSVDDLVRRFQHIGRSDGAPAQ